MLSAIEANELIKPAVPKVQLRKKKYKTNDIVSLVNEVISTDKDDTEALSKEFSPTRTGVHKLFDFVDIHFEYSEDPKFNQWVQTPSYIWATKKGDCKSFTVFISSVLYNMGIGHYIRYVSYGSRYLTHVYPVAKINGIEVPLDVVYKKQENGLFGTEKKYHHKKDYYVEGLYKLGSVASTNAQAIIGKVQQTLEELETAFADIPDSIITAGAGDVTRMTSGQLDRIIWADRYHIFAEQESSPHIANQLRWASRAMEQGDIAGIGSLKNTQLGRQVQELLSKTAFDNRPAFQSFKVGIPNPIAAKVKGIFSGIGKFFKKVGKAIAGLYKKFVNWIFKGIGKKMAPYFLFLFVDKSKSKSGEVKRRMVEQQKTFDWIARKGKLEKDKLMGIVFNGIKEKTGKAPQEILNEAAKREVAISGAFVAWALKAIGFVINVISKITSLFKGNKEGAGKVNEENVSDPEIVEKEEQESTEGSNAGLLAAFGLVPLVFAFT